MDAKQLLTKYKSGECTPEECALVETYYNKFIPDEPYNLPDETLNVELEAIYKSLPIHKVHKPIIRLGSKITVAASILLCLLLGSYWFFSSNKFDQQIVQNKVNDIAPGGNKATLTLSDGRKINLADAANGLLFSQQQVKVNKVADGRLVYTPENALQTNQSEFQYNSITTPKGGNYSLKLADGTLVFLDAASSIRYPVVFKAKERRVEITGQVYFEVAHQKSSPFLVSVKGQTVEVLGTHFNINAYDDEPALETTLIQGRVKVSAGNETRILMPGQQSSLSTSNHKITVTEADTDEVLAWKNGMFTFKNADIKTVMRQLSRWYNVKVVYKGAIPSRLFSGKIHRSNNAALTLEILNYSKVRFIIEKPLLPDTIKTIVVTP